MALAVKACLMACHMHIRRLPLSGKEKQSVFNLRANQEHSLKSAPYLLLVLSLISDGCYSWFVGDTQRGQQFMSQQGGRGLTNGVRGLISVNTSLVTHLSHSRTT